MTKEELENWQKIKDHFEKINQTDNNYYKRACIICAGGSDPEEFTSTIEMKVGEEE